MNTPGEPLLKVGDGMFHPLRGELFLGGRTVKLRPRTAVFLSYLVRNPGRPLGKDELLQAVWPDVVVTEDSLVQCVKEIRQALGDAGRDWIRTLPRMGYAFVADVQPQAAQVQAVQARPATTHRRLLALVGLLAVVVAGASAWRSPQPASPPARSFLVLPVQNLTGDPARESLAEEATEAFTNTFGQGAFKVVSPSTAFAYKGRQVDVRRLGADLNVRYVVQGVLRLDEGRPVLTVRMADTGSALQLWRQDMRIGPGWSQHLREDLNGVTTSLVNAMRIADAVRDGNPDAVRSAELVARARDLAAGPPATTETERQWQIQVLLEEALRLHDQSATAWSVLAHAYLHDVRLSPDRARKLARAVAAAERSVKLAPTSEPANITRGFVHLEERRPAQALKMFDRALELNPKNAWALAIRGLALVHLGRAQEGLESVRLAMRLSPEDPRRVRWHTFEGVALLHLGQDEAALQALAHGATDPSPVPFAHLYLASALALTGRIEEARAEVAQFPQRYPGVTLGRWRATEPSDAPAFLQQREHLYEGLRRAGMPQ